MFRRRSKRAESTSVESDKKIEYDLDSRIEKEFPNCVGLVRDAVNGHRRRYRRQARRHFRWFRVVGTAEIALSLSLPIIALVGPSLFPPESQASNYLVAVVSILVALVTALQSFFRWQENWQLFSLQSLSLDSLITEWRYEMIKLLDDPPSDKMDQALQRTGAFLQALSESLRSEHETFSDSVSSPEVPRLSHTAGHGGGS
jgi:hypothetical protein